MSHAVKAVIALFFLATTVLADVTKEDIRKLAAAGISDNVILAFIRANGPTARMTSDDLVELKAAGVSEGVLVALVPGAVPSSATQGVQTQDSTPPPALPQTTYVDYSSMDSSPTDSYYSSVPLDYYAPAYSYYYAPWYGACYPSWGCGAAFCTPGCGWGFGFPCYNSCFYPWYRGCFGSFGIGCSNFGCCFRPFGFCGRPFGSFHSGGSFGFGVRRGSFPSFFAASASVGATFRQASAIRSPNLTQAASFGGRANVDRPSPAAAAFQTRAAQPAVSTPRYFSRPNAIPQARGYYAPQPRSYYGGNTWRPAPSSSHWSGSYGAGGHGGGWGGGGAHGGGGGGGGGHGGGHGGHGR